MSRECPEPRAVRAITYEEIYAIILAEEAAPLIEEVVNMDFQEPQN
jgi:hypothetical protein